MVGEGRRGGRGEPPVTHLQNIVEQGMAAATALKCDDPA